MAEPNSTTMRGVIGAVSETTVVRDVADRIALLEPEAAPLVTFLNALKRKSETMNPKFEWFEDELTPKVVTTAANGTTNTTTMGVTTGQGVRVRVNDILIGPTGESVLITGISTDTLTITRSVGSIDGATWTTGDTFIIAGNAAEEGTGAPVFKHMAKVPKSNWIQIFRDSVKITDVQAATKQYGGDDRTYQRKKVAIQHKRGIEQAFLFGDGASTPITGATGSQYQYVTEGLYGFISTNITSLSTGTITEAEFETFLRTLFRYTPSTGPVTKVVFANPMLISAMNFWAKNALQVRSDEKTYGMRIATYRSGHGDIDLVRHWMLGDYPTLTGTTPTFGSFCFFVDPSNLGYRYLTGMDTKLHVDIGQKEYDYKLDEYRTYAGLECKLEKTHGLLKNVRGFAA